jgi:heat shock protein HtpX
MFYQLLMKGDSGMNVYDHIDANNRMTAVILCAFPIALFGIVFLFSYLTVITEVPSYARIGFRYLYASAAPDYYDKVLAEVQKTRFGGLRTPYPTQAFDLTLSVYPWKILAAFIWIAISYRAGGAMMLGMANARPVAFEENRELFRLVENTSIMAGLPMPKIYLIKSDSMNAFATGRKPEEASIALTDGIVNKLDKDELQAVTAHELAHIGNRDTRLMMITIAGIGCFTFFGELLCCMARGGGRNRRGIGTGVLFMIGIACLVFGYVVAPILRFALSRRREYQADATAVKITRAPEALARALSKIAENSRTEVLDACPLVGNMCIANPAQTGGRVSLESRLYSTHPPIEDRIAALRKMMGADSEPRAKAQVGRAVW